jgi:hypothetical protein
MQIATSALVTGTVASLISTATLAVLARCEGKSAAQPTNATSHWLHGDEAGGRALADMAHTGVGYATHHASAVFWALPFELWLAKSPPKSAQDLVTRAAVMSAVAAAIDYGITPRRLTPGWELTLSKPSMAGAFASLALGLAAGALVSRELRRGRRKNYRSPSSWLTQDVAPDSFVTQASARSRKSTGL